MFWNLNITSCAADAFDLKAADDEDSSGKELRLFDQTKFALQDLIHDPNEFLRIEGLQAVQMPEGFSRLQLENDASLGRHATSESIGRVNAHLNPKASCWPYYYRTRAAGDNSHKLQADAAPWRGRPIGLSHGSVTV